MTAAMAVCEHTTPRPCPQPGCTSPQAVRADGRPLGWCTKHWHDRLPSMPAGTVRPGPRNRGWRVKLPTGRWVPCDANGAPLGKIANVGHTTRHSDGPTSIAAARIAAAANSDHLRDTQRRVLLAIAATGTEGLTDHDHDRIHGMIQTTAGKRRLELETAGLVEYAGLTRLNGRGVHVKVWRCTPAGLELAARYHTTAKS